MSRNTEIIIKTASLILVFVIALSTGIFMLSFDKAGAAEAVNRFSSPEINRADTPVSRENLEKKFFENTCRVYGSNIGNRLSFQRAILCG